MTVDFAEQKMAGFDDGYQVVVSFSNTELDQLLSGSGLTEARTPIDASEAPEILMRNTPDLRDRNVWKIDDDVLIDNKQRFRSAVFACSSADCTLFVSAFET
ncbi:hypothetical protein [Antrihabitans spumae]|uniref:Uncharacterized protein n=1 Tax=Antrihabitans spumae TaxID=3373370 RepID=A0ABW7JJF4_9NOCA